MEDAVLNADGFGFGWLDPEKKLATYTNTQPIWADTNLTNLTASLKSRCWLANVRSATPGQAITTTNTHPFNVDGLLFTHNGYIENFNPDIRTTFHEILSPPIQASIQGNTDSEYLFALMRQELQSEKDLMKATQAMLTTLVDVIAGGKALLNSVVTDGDQFIILRHDVDRLPKNAMTVAEIEYELNIRSSFYFRIVKQSYDESIMKRMLLLTCAWFA